MKKILMAFEVDGTLIRNDGPGDMDFWLFCKANNYLEKEL